MTRVSLSNDKEEIYEAYQKALNNLRVQRHKNKQHVLHKRKIIKEKNKKYNSLHWKYFRMTQVLYGLNIQIGKLKNVGIVKKAEGIKLGTKSALSKINKIAFTTENPYRFLSMCDLLCENIGLSQKDVAFILWCNIYDFFSKEDFNRDLGDTSIQYYYAICKMQKLGYINKISDQGKKNIYSLTGTGKPLALKISKFVKNIK